MVNQNHGGFVRHLGGIGADCPAVGPGKHIAGDDNMTAVSDNALSDNALSDNALSDNNVRTGSVDRHIAANYYAVRAAEANADPLRAVPAFIEGRAVVRCPLCRKTLSPMTICSQSSDVADPSAKRSTSTDAVSMFSNMEPRTIKFSVCGPSSQYISAPAWMPGKWQSCSFQSARSGS